MFFGSMVNRFNLMSCAQSYFNPLYADPIVFAAILYVDCNRLADDSTVLLSYFVLFAIRTLVYATFMTNLVS